MENKKTKILTIVGVLVMIVMVTGISFALYTFTGTGSKENVITTGQISVSYEESSVIELTNQYPMSDELGIGNTESLMNFTVSGTIRGDANINYAIGLDSIVEGTTLTEEFVKVYLLKGDTVVSTFINGEGKKIGDLKSSKIEGILGGYVLYTDSFTTSGSQEYTIKAWVSDDYKLPTIVNGNNSSTTSEIFKFKIKVVATDALLTVTNTTI